MIYGIQLVRIQEITKIEDLVPYLVDKEFIVRLAAKSRFMLLLKEIDMRDPKYN